MISDRRERTHVLEAKPRPLFSTDMTTRCAISHLIPHFDALAIET